MATRTLSVTEAAYQRLKAMKGERESFSDVILKVTKKPRLLEFAGILSKGEVDEAERLIRESRKRSNERMRRIAKELARLP